jgi:hypothetical protein
LLKYACFCNMFVIPGKGTECTVSVPWRPNGRLRLSRFEMEALLTLVVIVGIWYGINRWILPKLGIPT